MRNEQKLTFKAVSEFIPFRKIISSTGMLPFDVYFKRDSALTPKKLHFVGEVISKKSRDRIFKYPSKFLLLESAIQVYNPSCYDSIREIFEQCTFDFKRQKVRKFIEDFFSPYLTIAYALSAFQTIFPIETECYEGVASDQIYSTEITLLTELVTLIICGMNNKESLNEFIQENRNHQSLSFVRSPYFNKKYSREFLATFSLSELIDDLDSSSALFKQVRSYLDTYELVRST